MIGQKIEEEIELVLKYGRHIYEATGKWKELERILHWLNLMDDLEVRVSQGARIPWLGVFPREKYRNHGLSLEEAIEVMGRRFPEALRPEAEASLRVYNHIEKIIPVTLENRPAPDYYKRVRIKTKTEPAVWVELIEDTEAHIPEEIVQRLWASADAYYAWLRNKIPEEKAKKAIESNLEGAGSASEGVVTGLPVPFAAQYSRERAGEKIGRVPLLRVHVNASESVLEEYLEFNMRILEGRDYKTGVYEKSALSNKKEPVLRHKEFSPRQAVELLNQPNTFLYFKKKGRFIPTGGIAKEPASNQYYFTISKSDMRELINKQGPLYMLIRFSVKQKKKR